MGIGFLLIYQISLTPIANFELTQRLSLDKPKDVDEMTAQLESVGCRIYEGEIFSRNMQLHFSRWDSFLDYCRGRIVTVNINYSEDLCVCTEVSCVVDGAHFNFEFR